MRTSIARACGERSFSLPRSRTTPRSGPNISRESVRRRLPWCWRLPGIRRLLRIRFPRLPRARRCPGVLDRGSRPQGRCVSSHRLASGRALRRLRECRHQRVSDRYGHDLGGRFGRVAAGSVARFLTALTQIRYPCRQDRRRCGCHGARRFVHLVAGSGLWPAQGRGQAQGRADGADLLKSDGHPGGVCFVPRIKGWRPCPRRQCFRWSSTARADMPSGRASRRLPAGWRQTLPAATREAALEYVSRSWETLTTPLRQGPAGHQTRHRL